MSIVTTIIQHSFWSPSHDNQRRKRNKRKTNWKEEVKLSLFADDMTLYIENLKDSTRKLLELINEFGKVAGYKINTQKSAVFLYTKNEHLKRKLKKNSIYNSIKNNKTLRNKPNQRGERLVCWNYKALLKEIKEDMNKWKDILFSRFGRQYC